MASSSTQHTQEYQKAVAAYVQGNYEEAAKITDQLVGTRPGDPNLRLLRGHIYCCQQRYSEAQEQYHAVLNATTDPELINLANESLAKIKDLIPAAEPAKNGGEHHPPLQGDHTQLQGDNTFLQTTPPIVEPQAANPSEELSLDHFDDFGSDLGTSNPFDDLEVGGIEEEFGASLEQGAFNPFDEDAAVQDPFAFSANSLEEPVADIPEIPIGESVQPLGTESISDDDVTMLMGSSPLTPSEPARPIFDGETSESTAAPFQEMTPPALETFDDPFAAEVAVSEESLFGGLTESGEANASEESLFPGLEESLAANMSAESLFGDIEEAPAASIPEESLLPNLTESIETNVPEVSTSAAGISDLLTNEAADAIELLPQPELSSSDAAEEEDDLFGDFSVSLEAFEAPDIVAEPLSPEAFDPATFEDEQTIAMSEFPAGETVREPEAPAIAQGEASSGGAEPFESIADFNLEDLSFGNADLSGAGFDDEMTIANPQVHGMGAVGSDATVMADAGTETFAVLPDEFDLSQQSLEDLADFSLDLSQSTASRAETPPPAASQDLSAFTEQVPVAAPAATAPTPSRSPSPVARTVPATSTATSSFGQQNITSAVTSGVLSALAAGAVSLGFSASGPAPLVSGTAAGLTAGVAVYAMGQRSVSRIKRFCTDLQAQCNAVIAGDMTARVPVTSNDELGLLAQSFNQMTDTIQQITADAQKKAEENERQRDDLQRQVIRLLDDVEGAARGDLTVQAEVTADVLGAVADSFNLTIHNLRTIVQQVKIAAQQVSRGAAENETFARSLSADALRQAEELAVTLNSVQMMTNAIQRVAESAQEANEVARNASETALRGGEAVERTVAGILQIRETVAETTRKVKRLAESSQEIAKIVGVISSIANRTNLLALNASIEAARAGEAGRGFAVVADEVRQLADRSAKASKEIEQIVLQIQSETGAVMTAMEEGTQQVIEGTKRAEQAKHALEDIIQVSSQIDTLVRSITNATVEQTESARAMAQVMQSIELTAQATSQEAQRVSDSLQGLVSVARNLQASVERFRVENTEDQA
ncbi:MULTISPECIES: methyl-accepting chemotaxis protein [unclassified Thermosynechococcus]|uniref:methyl-accepting chemotaxis protein n=1 Tax=unclassified Thermosynechococcus TaxID=2622553 RepID=UPI0028739A7C|nr:MULTISPECIES: methyl-accepting chemotaxis protein [unclassified Thermosynechococcus]WNC32585.1 methyl-accepting chemotaxis protein [Thermosynechococcus sp. PKX95]WNC35114.1 methyl-accepting chemotaxis protein [Thermosynechococcus sp. PKX91]WNC37632.1 methyl-accepting chemotaxis protein [Thermosynechococcus sp. WL11]WNC40153.1 methyl-accepting chemotaxis protein [Thermosynechococcus sp. WL17]WNC42673.1 methyl-accepting chemotaxis protein [Thermosynechococcus sp. WL15]